MSPALLPTSYTSTLTNYVCELKVTRYNSSFVGLIDSGLVHFKEFLCWSDSQRPCLVLSNSSCVGLIDEGPFLSFQTVPVSVWSTTVLSCPFKQFLCWSGRQWLLLILSEKIVECFFFLCLSLMPPCHWLVVVNELLQCPHTPLTQQSQSGLTMQLSRHSVGAYQEISSHATHQGALSHSHLSLLSCCGLILA